MILHMFQKPLLSAGAVSQKDLGIPWALPVSITDLPPTSLSCPIQLLHLSTEDFSKFIVLLKVQPEPVTRAVL